MEERGNNTKFVLLPTIKAFQKLTSFSGCNFSSSAVQFLCSSSCKRSRWERTFNTLALSLLDFLKLSSFMKEDLDESRQMAFTRVLILLLL